MAHRAPLLRFLASRPTLSRLISRSIPILATAPISPISAPHSRPASTTTGSKPLYPSVTALLHAHGLTASDASSIAPTGPGGRLLKGDVLAHLGQISRSYPSESAERISVLSKLDLSNIQLADVRPETPAPEPSARAEISETQGSEVVPELRKIKLRIDLAPLFALQDRIADTLGIEMGVSTLLDRAAVLANRGLPAPTSVPSSQDELFDALLGIKTAPRATAGRFVPLLEDAVVDEVDEVAVQTKSSVDLFDEILGTGSRWTTATSAVQRATETADMGVGTMGSEDMVGSGSTSVFSVLAPRADVLRARAFLGQMKAVLETEPGSLVL